MKRPVVIAVVVAVLVGAAYAAFGLLSPALWNSPDETGVAFFTKLFAQSGRLWFFDPYNVFAADLLHPRSIISVGSYLVPASFYGNIWIVGAFYKIIGGTALSLVAPLFTAGAGICVFFLARHIFEVGPRTSRSDLERKALVAEILFLTHPAVWYFSSRGLFPNILFFDLLIIGLSCWWLRPWKPAINDLVGVLAWCLAFAVRPVEFVWLAPLVAVAFWFNRKQISVRRIILPAALFALTLTAIFFTNHSLYGNALSFGYTAGSSEPGVSIPAISAGSRLPAAISAPRPYILPFGFHPKVRSSICGIIWFGFCRGSQSWQCLVFCPLSAVHCPLFGAAGRMF